MKKLLSLLLIAIAITAGSCLAQSLPDVTVYLTTDAPNASVVLQKGQGLTIDYSNLQVAENKEIDFINNDPTLSAGESPKTIYSVNGTSDLLTNCQLSHALMRLTCNASNTAGTGTIQIDCGSANPGDYSILPPTVTGGYSILPPLVGTVTVTVQ